MSKNVLVISGSPRKFGNTSLLSHRFIEILENLEIEYDICRVGEATDIKPCSACGACSFSDRCCKKDSITWVLDNFDSYIYVIWFTPIYFFQLPSQSKALLDRMGCSSKESWEKKKFFLFLVSGSSGRMSGVDLVVESFTRTSDWHNFSLLGYYNKVTNDEILPVSEEDEEVMQYVAKNLMR